MIRLFHLLDMAATLSEVIIAAAIFFCFNRNQRITGGKLRHLLPFTGYIILLYILTWYTDTGEFKLIIMVIFLTFALSACYRQPLKKCGILAMFSMVILLLTESMATVFSSFLGPPLTIMIDDTVLVNWTVYVTAILLRTAFLLLFLRFFRNYQYDFTWLDFWVMLLSFSLILLLFVYYYGRFFGGHSDFFSLTLEILTSLLSLTLLVYFFYFKNYHILKEKELRNEAIIRQMEQQYAYYQDKLKEEERVRSIYHDMKNHLLLLQPQPDKSREIEKSLREVQEQIAGYEQYHHTGNDFLDIIIRDKARIAKEKQTDFGTEVYFADGSFIDPLDISTIFGNALDNAIEAGETLPPKERLVILKAGRLRDMLSIVVENNISKQDPVKHRTSKADTFMHGFGLSNIRKAVEKYQGECSSQTSDSKYILKIIIPIPDK